MNGFNPYLHEEFYREQRQQIRLQVARNRMLLPRRPGLLPRIAQLLVRMGNALQQHHEKRLAQMKRNHRSDIYPVEAYYQSR